MNLPLSMQNASSHAFACFSQLPSSACWLCAFLAAQYFGRAGRGAIEWHLLCLCEQLCSSVIAARKHGLYQAALGLAKRSKGTALNSIT